VRKVGLLSKMKAGARHVVERAKTEVKQELKYRAAAQKQIKKKSKAAFWKEKERLAIKKAKTKARGSGKSGSGSGFDLFKDPFESGKKKKKEMEWF